MFLLKIQGFRSGDTPRLRSSDFDIRSRSDLHALATAFRRFRFLGDVQFRMLMLICVVLVAALFMKIVIGVSKQTFGKFGLIELCLVAACTGLLMSPL